MVLNTKYKDRDYFQEWKKKILARLGTECAQCSSKENLEIDHIKEEDKSFDICGKWTYFYNEKNKERQEELTLELAKCQLLCYECHKAKSAAYVSKIKLEKGFTHGTSYGWMKAKCDCQLCSDKKKSDQKFKNEKRRARDDSARGPYGQPTECGDIKSYHRGCRCTLCRAANAEKEKNRKLKKSEVINLHTQKLLGYWKICNKELWA